MDRGEMNLWTWVAALVVLGALTVFPLMFLGNRQAAQLEAGVDVLGQANAATAQLDLQNAMRAAQVYLAETGTFDGFGAEVASRYDASVTYNGASTARQGEVSVRGVTATTVVLATKSTSGDVFCAAADDDAVSYGRQDVRSAAACHGGW